MRPSQTLCDLEVLFAKQRGHLYRKGVRLKPVDSSTVREVYQQWFLLSFDLGYLTLNSNRIVLGQIISDFMSRDVFDLINTFADCVDLVRDQTSVGFKARLANASPHLWGFVKNDVFASSAGDALAAKRLLQLFSYPTRLSLTKIDLTNESLEAYRSTEASLPTEISSSIIPDLNEIIRKWVKRFDDSDLVFAHGNGSVAGQTRTNSFLENKYRDLFEDDLTRYAYKDYESSPYSITTVPTRISETVFVPKSYKAFRTISKEPSTLMYLQQGVWKELDRIILSTPYLRSRIDVHDQTRNQRMAREGSMFRNYGTIDLSAASDSVSWILVKKLFRGTKVLRHLFATRSTHSFLPDGELLKLKKFAPMGSALCFPIETIIFASICEYSTRKIARMSGERSIAGDYSVYGDDIIVPTRAVGEVIHWLTQLGFSVNTSKSFVREDSWFRESCGGEYCNGTDVTPMRVSRSYSSALDDTSFTSLADASNECYRRGYSYLRAFFLKKARSRTGYIPLFSETSLLSDNYTNYHTKNRWNRNLHRHEYRATVSTVNTKRGDEEIALRHWLESNKRRKRVYEGFQSNVGEKEIDTGINYVFGPQVLEVPESVVIERHNLDA